MVDRLTTEEVADRVSQLLPNTVETRSALTLAGATNISYETDVVRRVALGGPGLYKEGESKQLSDQALIDAEVYRAKLVYILLHSTEVTKMRNGQAVISQELAQAAAGLVRGGDIVIFNGTNPATGTARPDLATINLKDNAVQEVPTTSYTDGMVDALRATPKSTALILSGKGYSEVAFATNGTTGQVLYPGATKRAPFPFTGGGEAIYSDALGVNGWDAETGDIENTNYAAAGPWNTIGRAFSGVEVTHAETGTVGAVNLFTDNFEAFKIEVFFSFVIPNVKDFTVVKSA